MHLAKVFFIFFIKFVIDPGVNSQHLKLNKAKTEHIRCDQTRKYDIVHIPQADNFLLVEIHSQWYNITVSYEEQLIYGEYENGTDVGLVIRKKPTQTGRSSCYIRCQNPNQIVKKFNVLVKVTVHHTQDPTPGGCNMEFPLQEDPNIHLYPASFTNRLAFQLANIGYPASMPVPKCESPIHVKQLKYRLFEYHMKDGDISENEYIASMQEVLSGNITLDLTVLGGEVTTFRKSTKTEMIFARYRASGVIYSVVVEYQSTVTKNVTRALYVPTVRYSCGLEGLECVLWPAVEIAAAILIGFLGMAGLFIAFFGHRFFLAEMFFFGYLAMKIILLVIVVRFGSFGLATAGILVLGVGLLGGFLWWLFWYMKGIAILAVLVPGLVSGFVIACVAFNYTPLGSLSVFETHMNWGLAFASTMMIPPVVLLYFTRFLNLFSCAVVGSFLPIFAASLVLPGTFRNIILDTFKIVADPDYLVSEKYRDLNTNDIIFCTLWAVLAVASLAFQMWREHNRPPFPPCPYTQYRNKKRLTAVQNYIPVSKEDAITPTPVVPNNSYIVNGEREPLITSTWQPSIAGQGNYGGTSPGSRLQAQAPRIIDPI